MKNYRIDTFRAFYDEWKASGQSVRDYCLNNGINESRFYYWKKRIEESSLSHTLSGGFVPVAINQADGRLEMQPLLQGKRPAHDTSSYRIIYPNGVSIAIDGTLPLDVLRRLITLQD